MAEAPPPRRMVVDPDAAMMRALLDAYGGVDAGPAMVDWLELKRQEDERFERELAAAKAWRPKFTTPLQGGHIDGPTLKRLLAKIDSEDRRRERAKLRIPLPERWRRFPRYGMAALEGEARIVAAAPAGVRNETLNRSAWTLARLVREGILEAGDVERVLVAAAVDAGLPQREATFVVRSALKRRGAA